MRHIPVAALAAGILLSSGLAAHAQRLPEPAVGAYRPGEPIRLNNETPGHTPVLEPVYYGGTMLPASPSRPWIISSRFLYARYNTPGLGYGYRTSPNGESAPCLLLHRHRPLRRPRAPVLPLRERPLEQQAGAPVGDVSLRPRGPAGNGDRVDRGAARLSGFVYGSGVTGGTDRKPLPPLARTALR